MKTTRFCLHFSSHFGGLRSCARLARWLPLAWVGLLLGALAACTSGTTYDPFTPSRVVAFGGALTYTDAAPSTSGSRYTVNDGSVNVWSEYVANQYGLTLANTGSGGSNYAQLNACISSVTGTCSSQSLSTQLSAFGAASSFGSGDLVIVEGGTSDVYAQGAAILAGTQTSGGACTALRQAAQSLAALVRQIKAMGAEHVLVLGSYDLSRSPWGSSAMSSSAGLSAGLNLSTLSVNCFNNNLLLEMADAVDYSNVQFADAAYYMNLLLGDPNSYGFSDSITVVCAATAPGDSSLCNTNNSATINPSYIGNYNSYAFADTLYFTPSAHRALGSYVMSRLRYRWG